MTKTPGLSPSCIALVALAAAALAHDALAQCLGDLNGDLKVSGADIGILLGEWGTVGSTTGADIDDDGTVGGSDLGVLLGAWGQCPVVPAWATLIEAYPDANVVTSATLRNAITATGRAWRVRDTRTQIEMLLVPPGTFQRGCSASFNYGCVDYESPKHQVTLTSAFYLGRYEVTQSQWTAQMGSNPSYFQRQSDSAIRPVEQVSWNSIQDFLSTTGMRLPTEAEWEYAYRAGTNTAFHGFTGYLSGTNDDALVMQIAWNGYNSDGQTRPIGQKLANGFGLHDMSGNVHEWVNDWFGSYSQASQTNPTGPLIGTTRVFRGGCWGCDTDFMRSSDRGFTSPGFTQRDFGFRVARDP